MPVSSYLVFPDPRKREAVRLRLGDLPGCEVTPALNHDLLLLVMESEAGAEEESLRRRVEEMDGVQALALAFAEVTAS